MLWRGAAAKSVKWKSVLAAAAPASTTRPKTAPGQGDLLSLQRCVLLQLLLLNEQLVWMVQDSKVILFNVYCHCCQGVSSLGIMVADQISVQQQCEREKVAKRPTTNRYELIKSPPPPHHTLSVHSPSTRMSTTGFLVCKASNLLNGQSATQRLRTKLKENTHDDISTTCNWKKWAVLYYLISTHFCDYYVTYCDISPPPIPSHRSS